jgi:uncharacterized SAM-binding protein YcdF (DUF218 family)
MSRLRGLILVLICLAAMWGGGLIRFAGEIPASVNDAESETDAIVVLTGGSQRLETGAQLLTIGKAEKLFISGVYHGVDAAELMKPLGTPAETIACCVVLGHGADNTRGNAVETASWMREQGYHSLRLVTSAYHMPRSLLEFTRAMPDTRILPNPVFAENVKQQQWWAWPGTASLVINEYNKYLVALIRPLITQEAAS